MQRSNYYPLAEGYAFLAGDFFAPLISRGSPYQMRGPFSGAIAGYSRGLAIDAQNSVAQTQLQQPVYSRPAIAVDHPDDGKDKDNDDEMSASVMATEAKDEAKQYNEQGIKNIGLGNFQLAIDCFNKALISNPALIEVYANRALAHKNNGNNHQAIKDTQLYLGMMPDKSVHESIYNSLGELYFLQGKLDFAIEYSSQALEINANYALAYHNLARVYYLQQNLKETIFNYLQAIKRDADNQALIKEMKHILKSNTNEVVDEAIRHLLPEDSALINQYLTEIVSDPDYLYNEGSLETIIRRYLCVITTTADNQGLLRELKDILMSNKSGEVAQAIKNLSLKDRALIQQCLQAARIDDEDKFFNHFTPNFLTKVGLFSQAPLEKNDIRCASSLETSYYQTL